VGPILAEGFAALLPSKLMGGPIGSAPAEVGIYIIVGLVQAKIGAMLATWFVNVMV